MPLNINQRRNAMNNIPEMYMPTDKWILPSLPLLDEEFDDESSIANGLGIPVYDHKNEISNH
jgi:hypothetical protein